MRFALFRSALAAVLLVAGALSAPASDDVMSKSTTADFEDVTLDIESAIVNRGYVIDYRGHIGDMLARTAADVGAETTVYRNAELFQFCSAVLSRKAMEEDPASIAYCPYVIFAYEREDAPGTVHVGFRKLPASPARDAVNALLADIVGEVAGE